MGGAPIGKTVGRGADRRARESILAPRVAGTRPPRKAPRLGRRLGPGPVERPSRCPQHVGRRHELSRARRTRTVGPRRVWSPGAGGRWQAICSDRDPMGPPSSFESRSSATRPAPPARRPGLTDPRRPPALAGRLGVFFRPDRCRAIDHYIDYFGEWPDGRGPGRQTGAGSHPAAAGPGRLDGGPAPTVDRALTLISTGAFSLPRRRTG
jgi:hypothetical protein